jgi:hypothetical protein
MTDDSNGPRKSQDVTTLQELVQALLRGQEVRMHSELEHVDENSERRHNHLMSLVVEKDIQYRQLFTERHNQYIEMFTSSEKATQVALTAAEKAVQAALIAAKEAVTKAEAASEKRFDSVNEFRNTLKDQQVSLMTRTEADVRFKSIEEKLEIINKFTSTVEGKSEGISSVWGWIFAAVATVWAVSEIIYIVAEGRH